MILLWSHNTYSFVKTLIVVKQALNNTPHRQQPRLTMQNKQAFSKLLSLIYYIVQPTDFAHAFSLYNREERKMTSFNVTLRL